MRCLLLLLVSTAALFPAGTARAAMKATQSGSQVTVTGEHFRLVADGRRGGQITAIELFDGLQWNRVLGADGQTAPALEIAGGEAVYRLANDGEVCFAGFESAEDCVRFQAAGTPRSDDGRAGPWKVRLSYEVYPEGAVFVDLDYSLAEGETVLAESTLSFVVDRATVQAPKYFGGTTGMTSPNTFPSGRVAFGMHCERSYTNEVEVLVERKAALAGSLKFDSSRQRFVWSLADGKHTLRGPKEYRNRFALGLGSASTGPPRANVIGQRVYHVINSRLLDKFFPTNDQIDRMVERGATMMIYHLWLKTIPGANGRPHADYHPRDHAEMVRSIDYAHQKGLRVGLYMRGIERYGLAADFFKTYCKRNWDGIYVDWHGHHCVAYHEKTWPPEQGIGDEHFSADGSIAPARGYFLFARQLRELVGAEGFLIGHYGFGCAGVLGNLAFDAYLPGEYGTDHSMFVTRDDTVLKGMMGGAACMPWTLSPEFRTPEAVAKMAAWGIYAHLLTGFKEAEGPVDPGDPAYDYILPYWRALQAIDLQRASVFNLPSAGAIAARSSNRQIECVVYKRHPQPGAKGEAYLIVAANLGPSAAEATLRLVPGVIGMSGEYTLHRVDAATGAQTPASATADTIQTGQLPGWGIVGFTLTKP
ncbi:MAG: hypothetical protein HUU20_13850 [Pirellulales bacterium]|nr:hypothetical protein [Pirellulales bacterium]